MRQSPTVTFVLAALLLGACGGGHSPTTRGAPPAAAPRPIDLDAVRTDVSHWIDAMWKAYVTADMNAYQPTIGTNLFTWSTSAKVSMGYAAALKDTESDFANFRRLAKVGAHLTYTGISRDIGLTPDGRVAWVATEKEILLSHKGNKHHLAIVSTGLMVKDRKGKWKKVHSHSGARVPMFAIASLARLKRLPSPADIGKQVGVGAEAVAARFRGSVTDPKKFAATISSGPHTQFAFGNAGSYLVGGHAVRKALIGFGKIVSSLTITQLRAAIVSPGVGWVSANVTAKFATFEGGLRVSAIYLLEKGSWNAVQVHLSFGHGNTPPFTPAANEVDCATESQLRSSKSDKQTLLRFRNLSKQRVEVHWIDETGKRQKLLSLDSGGEAMHQTWISYPFLFSDTAGKCLAIYFGRPQPTSAVYLGKK